MEENNTKPKDHIKIFGERLKKLIEGVETMKHFGLDDEILISWLCHKTKLSKKDIQIMLKSQDEFYSRLMKRNIIENL